MNQSTLTLDLRLLQRVGKLLRNTMKLTKKHRERLEWVGDAILRELVVQSTTVTLTNQHHMDIHNMYDLCCSNVTLALVFDHTVECCGLKHRTPGTTDHSIKWKADLVETAIGALCVSTTGQGGGQNLACNGLLDEIISVVFAVSIMAKESGGDDRSGGQQHGVANCDSNQFDQLELFDDSSEEETGEEEGEKEQDQEEEGAGAGENQKEKEKVNISTKEDQIVETPSTAPPPPPSSTRFSSVLGGAALNASLSLALYHRHTSATPQTLTRARQDATAHKQSRWKRWEDGRTFNGTASSPVRLCRTSSFMGNVHEWVADQMAKKNNKTTTAPTLIDTFCWHLVDCVNCVNSSAGTTADTTAPQSKKKQSKSSSLSSVHSLWRHVAMPLSQQVAYAAFLEHGIPRDALLMPRVMLKRKRPSKELGSSGTSSTREQKKPRPRGPSITVSKQDMDLLCRFGHSTVVETVDAMLHTTAAAPQTIVLKEGLDRRICHALCAAHGIPSRSITFKNGTGVEVRGVQILNTVDCSVDECSVMAAINK